MLMSMQVGKDCSPDPGRKLAMLREDLVLSAGPSDPTGSPTWRVYDPLRHRFIAIDDTTRRALAIWRDADTPEALAEAIERQAGRLIETTEIDGLLKFMRQHDLLESDGDGHWRQRFETEVARKHGIVMKLVHNYLFFRVPLLAPEPVLRSCAGLVVPLYCRRVQAAIALFGVIGLFLAFRQWDVFVSDARSLFTASGLAQFGAMLFVVKIFHELAHAFTAYRAGCRVPTLGVAFMMMAPVLYTDVTDAWKLTDRRQRLAIDFAGIAVELGIACIATFLWAFLPEGAARQVAFLLATTSWTMSLAINLNPLMRFDGYYIASDLLGVENLQSRAFDFGVWRLRELLFGLALPAPEVISKNLERVLVAFAWTTWCYRLVLFTGIALAVYAYFFKALGIILFLFEIGYFIAKPIIAELKVWWGLRSAILGRRRSAVTGAAGALAMLLFVVPYSSDIRAPAVLEAAETGRIFAPRAGRIVGMSAIQAQRVHAGDVLFFLEAPDLESDRRTYGARLAAVDLRLARASADKEDRNEHQVLLKTRNALIAKLEGIERERRELVVRAPMDGILSDIETVVHVGRWVSAKEQLALVRNDLRHSITGYVRESDLWRIHPGTEARFVAELPQTAIVRATLVKVANASAAQIDQPELCSPSGGPIEVNADSTSQRNAPLHAYYRVTLTIAAEASIIAPMRLRGTLHINGEAESFLTATWRHILKVLVRESSA